jgi:hypothetical protein
MNLRLAAVGLAAALLGAAVLDSAFARSGSGHGRSGGSSGTASGMSSGHFRSGAAMPSSQFHGSMQFTQFRAPRPSTQSGSAMPSSQPRSTTSSGQVRSAPVAGQPVPGTRHVHPGTLPSHAHNKFHHNGKAFVTTGVVFPAYYPYYPYYPFYPYNGFYPGPAPGYAPPGMWYFCPALGAYYPYVQECPSGWQPVQPGSY